jgi:enediyne biosynthesis protein E4
MTKRMKITLQYFFYPAYLVVLFSCNNNNSSNTKPIFKTLTASQTGLQFSNTLTPSSELNLLTYMYYYNGAGAAAADFNNDGLVDLFFCANQSTNKIFLNKGKMQFTDVTQQTKIPNDGGWNTGASVIDINNDGLLDIYVSRVGNYKILKSKNQLLVCTGLTKDSIPMYEDKAAEYGLDLSVFGTQAAFLDYDADGDLDVFLLTHSVNHDGNYAPRKNFENTFDSLAGQKMLRNDIIKLPNGTGTIKFTDVSKTVGINSTKIGYGLGVTVSDINMDGYPDIYVGNDFHENDYLYMNQKNGTFKDEITTQLRHTSMFSMGVDVADINNDAKPEIISVDMLPYNPEIFKRSLAEDDYTIYNLKINYGYNYQYARNNLQYNNGNNTFSEIGQYAGVYNTDWSWAPLWMDFNNDGLKDLFISNGIPKRMNDIDYVNFVSDETVQNALRTNGVTNKELELINKFPEIKLPNQFYINKGNAKFENTTATVENNLPTFSNGSVYADFDNDGDLDIVVNNINDDVMFYQNQTNADTSSTYSFIKPTGDKQNINAIGSKILLYSKQGVQSYENYPVHGFLSSMQLPMHIGLGNTKIDSAILIWPNNTFQKIEVTNKKLITITYKEGLPKFDYSSLQNRNTKDNYTIEDITAQCNLLYTHQENVFNEFDREPLIPFMNTTKGPAVAVADINKDGLEDVFIGSSKTFKNAIFLQQPNGAFSKILQPQMAQDSMWENVDATWTDVNNDGNVDLLIASGGNEYYGQDSHMLPLLYLNDGKGNMTRKGDAFPTIFQTQSCIKVNDFNADGKIDVFIGCLAEPWNYGNKVNSYLLQNDGTGKFTNVTQQFCNDLQNVSMITNAEWVDLDRDKDMDLVTCSYWGEVNAFVNTNKKFAKQTLLAQNGFWNMISPTDINNDGKIDFVVGNMGTNNKFNASAKEPVRMYYNDFDGNEKKESIVTYYLNGEEIPLSSKMEIEKRLPFIKKKYLYAADYAKASLSDMFGKQKLESALVSSVNNLQTVVLLNEGNNKFKTIELPYQVQWSSTNAAASVDFNKDGLNDILLTGNFYDNNIQLGRYDANYGMVLTNKGNATFQSSNTTLPLSGQIRKIAPIKIKDEQAYLVVKNNDALQVVKFK